MRRWILLLLPALGVLAGQVWGADTADVMAGLHTRFDSPREFHEFLAAREIQSYTQLQRLPDAQSSYALGQGDFDVLYYKLELRVDEVNEILFGRLTMRARALGDGFSTPVLNFSDTMVVDSIYDNGMFIDTWTQAADLINVTLSTACEVGEEFEITVVYHGHPIQDSGRGFFFLSRPWMSTSSQPYGPRTWWPCKDFPDDKADSVDIIVEVSADLVVSSNGILRDTVHHDSTITFWWHEGYPISTYLVALSIADFEHFRRWYSHGPGGADSMPVDFFCLPEEYDTAVTYWPATIPLIEFMADLFGEYPFTDEKYAITHSICRGMEYQTNTYVGRNDEGYEWWLMFHELAHQWWGDYITCESWHHLWLNEGFASYCEALYMEAQRGGMVEYHKYMKKMELWCGGSIYCSDTSSYETIFTMLPYDKGAWVLHMLRGYLGDEVFFDAMRAYYNEPGFAYGTVVTEDFRDVCEAVSGRDLHEFFQDWIYGEYYPNYEYSWVAETFGPMEHTIYLHLDQVQATNPQVFDMPIDIGFDFGEIIIRKIVNNMRSQDYVLTSNSVDPPPAILLDPNNWILDQHTVVPYTFHLINYTLSEAAQYSLYHDNIVCKGGTAPYRFSIADGALPGGLVLDETSGMISGAAEDVGNFVFIVLAEDGGEYADSREYTLTVTEGAYTPGDLDLNNAVNPIDVVYLVNYVYRQSPPPSVLNTADVNGDCAVNPVDVVVLVNYVYRNLGSLAAGCAE